MLKFFRTVIFCLFAPVLFSPVSLRAQVVISEILAENEATAATGLLDEDKERSDWIEIYNAGAESVDLTGWSLTDDPLIYGKWRFPATNIVANGYVVVFASGKNRAIAGKQLHTNFKMSAGGEYLALFKPNAELAFEFAPEFPQQDPNVSYGLEAGSLTELRYFATPTPNAVNGAGQNDVSPRPIFLTEGGQYVGSVTVSLQAPPAGAVIRYTVNGTIPIATSTVYTTPLTFSTSAVVRAKCFVPGLVPSTTVTRTYNVMDATVVNFSSPLPVLVLSTFGKTANETTPIPVSAMLIGTNGTRAYMNSKPDFAGRGTIKIRGSSSTQFPKKSYAFELQDELGLDRKASLLGLPKESDWVLYAPYTDKTLMRDYIAYELCNAIGTYAPHTRFVDVYLDQGNKLAEADYVGVYMLTEKIKRSDNRVDIDELLPTQTTQPEVSGGYIFKKDRLDPGDVGFSTTRAGGFAWVEPKEQQVVSAQKTYLASYLSQFENALYTATSFSNRVYTNYYDVAAGIDHHWMVEAMKNIDGFRLSTFVHKDRGGKITMGPIWDYNLTLGNANYADGENTGNWYNIQLDDASYPWYRQLFKDPDFNQQYIDRWGEIRRGPFATTNVLSRVIDIANALAEPATHNYNKWRILGVYVWPNAAGYQNRKTFRSEVDWMTNWMNLRFAWIDKQFPGTPKITSTGDAQQGFTVTITKTNAFPIYYTTDGTDPRLPRGGISPKAIQYSGPFTVSSNARIFARGKGTSTWSPPDTMTLVVQTPPIVITELNFWREFVELKNIGASPVDLKGFRLRGGIDYTFNDSLVVPPGGFTVVTNAPSSGVYPSGNVVGPFNGHLANEGDHIVLEGSLGEPIMNFTYDDTWFPATDALSFSIVIRDEHAALSTWGLKESWRTGSVLGGTPGVAETLLDIPNVLVNEILLSADGLSVEAVEVYNPTDSPADVGGWVLVDDSFDDDGHSFHIPSPRVIQPKGYTVITKADFDPARNENFFLTTEYQKVHLFSSGNEGLTGYADGFSYTAAAGGLDYARHVSSEGKVHYVLQTTATLGAANPQPGAGPIVINEIRYSPFSFEPEFLELKNITSQDVKLFDPDHPTNTWRINGMSFSFPTNVTIPANGFAVIAQNDPARFKTTNNVGDAVQVFWFDGHLQGNGENLQVLKPAAPMPVRGPFGLTEKIPMLVVDEIRYDQKTPWPTPIPGASIERNYSAQYGNDPANWSGAIGATPGFDNRAAEGWQTWLQQVFTPAELGDPVVSDPDADPDQDGYTNEAEFVAGTNPKNATSGLLLAPAKAAPATLEFAAAPDRTYTLYYRPLVGDGAWTAVSVYRASSTARTVQITPTQPGYYKIAVP